MMREGFWLNYSTGTTYVIDDHERWIKKPENARILGLSERVIASSEYRDYTLNRTTYLLSIMKKSPIMRVRGHGLSITFEYAQKKRWKKALAMIHRFIVKQEVGGKMQLVITNLSSLEQIVFYAEEFNALYNSGGHKAVIKNAVVLEPIARNVFLVHERQKDEHVFSPRFYRRTCLRRRFLQE